MEHVSQQIQETPNPGQRLLFVSVPKAQFFRKHLFHKTLQTLGWEMLGTKKKKSGCRSCTCCEVTLQGSEVLLGGER